MKTALITGITGQDGAYLADLLISKGYLVHGIKRRSSSLNTTRIDHLYRDPHCGEAPLRLHYGDLTDSGSLNQIIQKTQPDEIYNLGAQSHVRLSFDAPEYTTDVNAMGTLRILEAIRSQGLEKKTRFYQASTSELYGLTREVPQRENTPFYPRSPYAIAKLYAYWTTVNYREAYGIYACNGILFNHESPKRGETFVTRKITRAVSKIAHGNYDCIYLGNIDSQRDWGHAKDYVEAMWLMLQQNQPEDFVIATGISTSIREFLIKAFLYVGVEIQFEGTGLEEVAKVFCSNNSKYRIPKGQIVMRIDPRYYRPTEVDILMGDAGAAAKKIGWKPKIDIDGLIEDMMKSDLNMFSKQRNVQSADLGFNE